MAEYPSQVSADPSGKPGPGRIQSIFDADHARRHNTLEIVRECARLSIPSALPPEEQQEDYLLPENHQSLGARGVTNLVGKTTLGVFPPDRPWAGQEVAAEDQYDPDVPPAVLQLVADRLFLQDLLIIATLESANLDYNRGDMLGFRTLKRQAIQQCIVTGDVLERLDSQYRLTVFRRDRFVTRRFDNGQVSYHVTWEPKDPLELGEEAVEEVGLKWDELRKTPAHERVRRLYTKIEWCPVDRDWLIEQELNGHVFNTSEEPLSNHFSTPFDLAPGENYGRGLIELNRGDLASFDALCRTTLEFAATAAKCHPVINPGSEIKPEDLLKRSGQVLIGRVVNGVVQDVGMLQANRLSDFQVVHLAKEQIRADLGRAFLLDSESVRKSERTTAFEVQEVTIQELQGALGGIYTPIADRMQLPLFLRTRWQLEKDKKLPTMPEEQKKHVRIRVLSGIEALSRMARATRMLSFAEVVRNLGPAVAGFLNYDVLLGVLARLQGIYEPNLIKSPQEREQDKQAALALAAQQAGQEKAVDVAGNVVQSNLTAQGAGR